VYVEVGIYEGAIDYTLYPGLKSRCLSDISEQSDEICPIFADDLHLQQQRCPNNRTCSVLQKGPYQTYLPDKRADVKSTGERVLLQHDVI
jgi:hypothetical protein